PLPYTTLFRSWPHASRVLRERVSVMSSTSLAVMSDSMSPTSAIASAYGASSVNVSHVSGTSGTNSSGSERGSSPSSPTVGTWSAKTTTTAVTSTIDTSGAGTALVTLGHRTMTSSPPPTSA